MTRTSYPLTSTSSDKGGWTIERLTVFAAYLCTLFVTCPAHARTGRGWGAAMYVPLDRLITNAEAFVKEHPNDPRGYYLLARIHYFTFVDQLPFVPIRNLSSYPPELAADWPVGLGPA